MSEEVALQRLGVLVPAGSGRDVLVPSLAGLLTLGVYPQQFFPQLNVTFVVLPAAAKGVIPEGGPRFLDNRSFGGPIPVMVIDEVWGVWDVVSEPGPGLTHDSADAVPGPLLQLTS